MNTKLLISTNNDAKNTKCRKLKVIPIPKLNGNLTNLLYIRLAFACWTAPLIGMLYAVTGLFSPKATDKDRAEWKKSGEDIMDLGDHALAEKEPAKS